MRLISSAVEAAEKAQLLAIRASSIAFLVQGEKQLGTLTGLDEARKVSFTKKFADLRAEFSNDLTQILMLKIILWVLITV